MQSSKQVEEIKLSVPWGHIAGKAWGDSSGSHVLVVHGYLDNAGSFDRLLPMLPDNFYYIVIDLPGHGLSSSFPQGTELNFFDYVLSIRLVLDALNWNTCSYIGHSFGAQLGIFLSIICPGRIDKIMCIDGLIPLPIENNEIVKVLKQHHANAMFANNAKPPILYTKDEIVHALKVKRNFPLNSEAAEALFPRATTKVGDLYKYNRDLRLKTPVVPIFNMSQYMHLKNHVKIPVFLTIAESSWFQEQHYKFLSKTFESVGNTFVRIPGNHDVHNNNPENVAPHVIAFLNGTHKSKL